MGGRQLDALLDLMDADGDGRVSYYDFAAFARASGGERDSADAGRLAKLRARLAKGAARAGPAALDRAFRAQKDADARDATAPPKGVRRALEEELGDAHVPKVRGVVQRRVPGVGVRFRVRASP